MNSIKNMITTKAYSDLRIDRKIEIDFNDVWTALQPYMYQYGSIPRRDEGFDHILELFELHNLDCGSITIRLFDPKIDKRTSFDVHFHLDGQKQRDVA